MRGSPWHASCAKCFDGACHVAGRLGASSSFMDLSPGWATWWPPIYGVGGGVDEVADAPMDPRGTRAGPCMLNVPLTLISKYSSSVKVP